MTAHIKTIVMAVETHALLIVMEDAKVLARVVALIVVVIIVGNLIDPPL